MNTKITGPLVFTLMLFCTESIIKCVAFDFNTVFFEIGPKLCLWATGILFGIVLCSKEQYRGQERIITKEKFLYILVYSICAWMETVVLSQKSILLYHEANVFTLAVQGLVITSFVLAGLSIGGAVTIAREVDNHVRNE